HGDQHRHIDRRGLNGLELSSSRPPLRVAFSDNFRVTAEAVVSGPKLKIINDQGQWTLSWDATFADWNIESAGTVTGPWAVEPSGTPFMMGTNVAVTLPNEPPNAFFRLHKP